MTVWAKLLLALLNLFNCVRRKGQIDDMQERIDEINNDPVAAANAKFLRDKSDKTARMHSAKAKDGPRNKA